MVYYVGTFVHPPCWSKGVDADIPVDYPPIDVGNRMHNAGERSDRAAWNGGTRRWHDVIYQLGSFHIK